jgi:hypothetical protein
MNGEKEPIKPPNHRAKFVMIDPLAIDKRLLYKIDGKFRIGLILCTEPGPDGRLRVEQAMPNELFHAGKYRSPVVGSWHSLKRPWERNSSKGSGRRDHPPAK